MKPDMLSMAKPEKEKKAKAEKLRSQKEQTATVCGLISGIPQSLSNAP